MKRRVSVLLAAAATATMGCVAATPSPREAAREYHDAVASADADALYELLTATDQKHLSREEVRTLLARDRVELTENATGVAAPSARLEATARVRYKDGESATLVLEGESYRVASAGAVPGAAKSPSEALEQLRRALARRSYPAVLRILSPTTREAVEKDFRSLVQALEKASSLPVQTSGDVATVETAGGHRVKLRRENGLWFVEDFD